MWIIIKLYGNREEQKTHHKNLRVPIRDLLESKDILGFVMTYHKSNLYLCMDVPSLTDCSMNNLRTTSSLSRVMDYVKSSCQYEVPDDYLAAIQKGITKNLRDFGMSVSQEVLALLVNITLDNASRGCMVALQILERKTPIENDPCRFYESIVRECTPMNGCFIISNTAHFCFNSLGFSNIEERAIKCSCTRSAFMSNVELTVAKAKASEALRRLGSRESGIWE